MKGLFYMFNIFNDFNLSGRSFSMPRSALRGEKDAPASNSLRTSQEGPYGCGQGQDRQKRFQEANREAFLCMLSMGGMMELVNDWYCHVGGR